MLGENKGWRLFPYFKGKGKHESWMEVRRNCVGFEPCSTAEASLVPNSPG